MLYPLRCDASSVEIGKANGRDTALHGRDCRKLHCAYVRHRAEPSWSIVTFQQRNRCPVLLESRSIFRSRRRQPGQIHVVGNIRQLDCFRHLVGTGTAHEVEVVFVRVPGDRVQCQKDSLRKAIFAQLRHSPLRIFDDIVQDGDDSLVQENLSSCPRFLKVSPLSSISYSLGIGLSVPRAFTSALRRRLRTCSLYVSK